MKTANTEHWSAELVRIGNQAVRGAQTRNAAATQQVLLVERLRAAIARLNPQLTSAAWDEALQSGRVGD
ncbi:hypothetical protein [Zoogloea sp.]|uniref:hypothetical protein n=1 Tax=Zoogloea sp. TaxID=49181 RepID=UPI0026024697|nr:hypothetical protein [Zoogloea sp.]